MTIQEYVERGREAVEAIKDYDQAQTDKLVYEAAKVIYQHAAELAREAVAMAIQNMEEAGGIGHTAGIFSNDRKHIEYYGERIPVARVLVNQPTPDAWGPSTNGLSPAVSESCGTWGNNILCENVDYIHLINVSKIALPLDVQVPSPEELFKN